MKTQSEVRRYQQARCFFRPTLSTFLALSTLLITLPLAGCSTSYDKEVQKSLVSIYGHDFDEYVFRASPVGNFGVGTMYARDIEDPGKNPESGWLIGHPDTMFEPSVSAQEKAELLARIFPEGSLGSKKLSQTISTGLSLEAVIPNLRGLIDAGGDVDLSKGVSVTLSASEAVNRRMNWTEFVRAIKAGQIKSEIAKYLNRPGSFVLGAADIRLEGFKAFLTVDKSVNASLHASLNEAAGKVLGKESSLKVKVSQSEEGAFTVEAVNPVIAAVLWKEPPSARGPLLAENVPDPREWGAAGIDQQKLTSLEKLLSQ
jgi:hypothetical protein